MKRAKVAKPRTGNRTPVRRNMQNLVEIELRAPAAPEAPTVAGPLLRGAPISFVKFLRDEQCDAYCSFLFGEHDTSAGTMLAELRKALDFPAFYHGRTGKLSRQARTKKLLKRFARRAYRGDPNRRGVVFWERVAWLIWNASAALTALRARAEKIKQLEIERIASLPATRRKRAAYMRRYRAKRDSKRRAKSARYVKPEAKQRWKEQRLKMELKK